MAYFAVLGHILRGYLLKSNRLTNQIALDSMNETVHRNGGIIVTPYERNDVSNHKQLDCFSIACSGSNQRGCKSPAFNMSSLLRQSSDGRKKFSC